MPACDLQSSSTTSLYYWKVSCSLKTTIVFALADPCARKCLTPLSLPWNRIWRLSTLCSLPLPPPPPICQTLHCKVNELGTHHSSRCTTTALCEHNANSKTTIQRMKCFPTLKRCQKARGTNSNDKFKAGNELQEPAYFTFFSAQ